MPRLVHLTRASRVRAIERAGLRGAPASTLEKGGVSKIEKAVFVAPLAVDFATTFQWLRELRRFHDERMVAVHVVLPSDEEVLVGRYNEPHARLSLRDAVQSFLRAPLGNEIIVPRSVRRNEVVAIRDLTQLVGRTENPDPKARFDCVCQMCLPSGARDLMRRVRASFERHAASARRSKSGEVVVDALQSLNMPLERARGRIEPDPLLRFARSSNPKVRRAVACLFGHFR